MTRINTNVTSMLAARVLNTQQTAMQTSLTRLSTGLRINSGSDDPAGLIASEILRGSKTGLTAAIANGERASNVIGTAEGALNEVSNLLSELQDLVASAANKGGQSADEIAAKQQQVDSILSTINRIADSTEFEGMKLLNGTMDYTTSGVDAGKIKDLPLKAVNMADSTYKTVVVKTTASAQLAIVAGSSTMNAGPVTLQVTGNYGTQVFTFASQSTAATVRDAIVAAKDLTGVSAIASTNNRVYFVSTEYGSDSFVTVTRLSGTWAATGLGTDKGRDVQATINGQAATGKGLKASVNNSNLSVEIDMTKTLGQATTGANSSATFYVTGGGATFSLAADVLTGRSSIGIQSIATGSLGNATDGYLNMLSDGQMYSLSSKYLGTAQRIVNSAIKEVANLRGRLGAFQKLTIGSTINSMNVALENVSAAESAIRDTDFARETASMARSQILVQAATSVLRQATAAPQNVLALVQ